MSPLHLRSVKKSVRVMFSSLLTWPQQLALLQEAQPLPPLQPPAPDRQGQHPALCTLQRVGLSCRRAIKSPLTRASLKLQLYYIPLTGIRSPSASLRGTQRAHGNTEVRTLTAAQSGFKVTRCYSFVGCRAMGVWEPGLDFVTLQSKSRAFANSRTQLPMQTLPQM